MNYFICSSGALLKYFNDNFNADLEYWPISVRDSKFSFDGRKADFEIYAKSNFTALVERKSISQLHKFLKMIEDQPLTLGFDSGRWIFIKEAIL